MTPIEELDRIRTDPYYRLAKSLSGPSLAQQKAQSVQAKLAEKQAVQDPATRVAKELAERDALRAAAFGGEDTGFNLPGLAFSSVLRGGGNVTDFVKRGLNGLTLAGNADPYFDASPDTGFSNQAIADEAAGVSIGNRENLKRGQHQVLEDVADGNIGDAILSAGKVALPTAFDSAGAGVELGLGAAATALTGGVAAPVLANRARKIFNTGENLSDRVKEIKAAKAAARAAAAATDTKVIKGLKAAPKKALKIAGQTSIVNADMTQQQYNAFVEKHGEDPSVARQSAMMLGNAITLSANPAIVTKLLIPNFKKQFAEENKTLLKNMGKGSNIKNIGKRIASTAKAMVVAGGAETVQEYLQTWQEILVTEISPKEADNLFQAIGNEVASVANRNQALQGGILGGAAGAATRGVTGAPTLAAGTALDATKATAKGAVKAATKTAKVAGRISQKVANNASFKILSQEERDQIAAEHEIRKEVVKEKQADLDKNAKTVFAAKTVDELRNNPDIADAVSRIQVELEQTDDDLSTPKEFKRLKDALVRAYKSDSKLLDVELATSNVADIAKKSASNIKVKSVEKAKAVIDALDIDIDKTVETVKQYGQASVTAVKELRSSTALGIIELVSDKTAKSAKENAKTALAAAKSLELRDLERVSAVVGQINKPLGQKLRKLADDKRSVLEKTGLKRTDIITQENLSAPIKEVAASGTVSTEQATAVASLLNQTLNSKISDLATLETVESAVRAYKGSEAFTEGTGPMTKAGMKVLEAKLETASKRIRKPIRSDAKQKLADIGEAIKAKGLIPYFKDSSVVKETAKLLDSDTAQDFITKVKEAIPDLPDLETEEQQDAFFNQVQETFDKVATTVKETVTGPADTVATPTVKEPSAKAIALAERIGNAVKLDKAAGIVGLKGVIPNFKKFGIETREEMYQAIGGIDVLNDPEILAVIDQAFPGTTDENVRMDEPGVDNMADEAVTVEQATKQYNEDFPGCSTK